ncbi:MAG TPA: hypothetical protein DCG90_11065 [Sphingobium sp.]|nr:hypothetical protein A7Q26_16120 [Sphingobium sp. TCM1]HAF42287.1 hypothetical protein [Sphingobium sp.]
MGAKRHHGRFDHLAVGVAAARDIGPWLARQRPMAILPDLARNQFYLVFGGLMLFGKTAN